MPMHHVGAAALLAVLMLSSGDSATAQEVTEPFGFHVVPDELTEVEWVGSDVERLLHVELSGDVSQSTWKRPLIGAAIGLAVGFAIGAARDSQQAAPGDLGSEATPRFYYAIRTGAAGLVIGGFIGWLTND